MRQRILVYLCVIFLLTISAIRAEGENVELVGRIPFGSALDIYVVENYAYLCAGGTLIIVDVIDPANPVEVGRIDTPGIACAVYVVGGYAYVADGPQGLRVIDVSNPENPREVGSYVPFYYRDSGAEILSGVHVAGKYAYLLWRGNLHVVDVSDPADPQEVTIYNSKAMRLHVTGDYAYLTESYGGLHVIDISRPENPQEVGFCEFRAEVEEVYVVGNYAYVAAGYDGLRVIDVSNPRMPREMGSCYIAGYATDVFAAGDLAYVAACYGIIRVIDVSDPKNLREVGACYGPPSSATGVYVAGDYAYLINDPSEFGTLDWSGLAVLDISSSRSLRASGFYYTHNYAEAVQVAGSYAYVADGTAGLRIIDISDPEKPDEIGFYDAPINAIELYVAGNYAYVIDTQEALHIVDVSDPRNPHEVSVYPVYLHDVFVAGNYAYIAASRDGLLVIDVSDPTDPRKVGSYDVPDDSAIISDVYVVGDYAYVIGMKTGFRILNISDPANPRELGYHQISGNICIAGRHAYIGTQVIDISDPANLHRVGYGLEFFRMHTAGSYAYLTKGKEGILVLDISDPTRPRQVGSYNTPGYAKGVYAVGDYAYVADGYGGLCILKYVGPSVVGNDPPVGNPQALITDVDTSVWITLTASDPDGDALTFQIESQPANGSLSGTAPNLTYQPNPGFIGTDSFIFTVHDGTVSSKPASVTIKVQHTPVAISQSIETVRDTPVQITLTGSDADGDALTFQIVRQPINGSLSGNVPDLTYEPKPGFVGIDSIIFIAHDGYVNSEPATVNIEIRPPNYHPVADPQTVTTIQNTPVQITLTGTDPDGDELTFEFVQPAYGSLSGTAPNLTYHPKHGYTGKDRFSFSVYDGELWSSPAEVTVVVEKTDRWNVEFVGSYDPRGYAQGVRVAGSYAYVTSAKAAGKGIEGLHVVDVSDPAEPYEVAFYEIPGISDGIHVSGDYAYVSAQTGTILNPYVHFHVVNISAPGNPYIAGSYRLLASWPGITPKPHGIYVAGGYAYVADSACGLRVIDISNPAAPQQVGLCVCSGALWDVFVDGSYAYTASIAAGNLYIVDVSDPSKPEQVAWWGSPFDRSYAIYVNDGYAYLSYSYSTGLSVFDVFDPKKPRQLGVQGIPGRLGDIHVAENLAYVAEIEGGLRVIDVSDPENLQEVGFYDTPNYSIGIQVSGDYIYIADGWGGLQILKYTGPKPTVNSPPVATPQSLTTNQDTPVQITLTGQDPDGDELSFKIISQPENGSLSGAVPDLTYTPNPGFAGEDSLIFRAYDGNAWSEPATVSIEVKLQKKASITNVSGYPKYVIINPFCEQTDPSNIYSLTYNVKVMVRNISSDSQSFYIRAIETVGVQIGMRYGDPNEDYQLLESIAPNEEKEGSFSVMFYGYTRDYKNEPVDRYLEFQIMDKTKRSIFDNKEITIESPKVGSICGVLVDSNLSPVSNGTISVYKAGSDLKIASGEVDLGGTYCIANLEPGDYSIQYKYSGIIRKQVYVDQYNSAIASFNVGYLKEKLIIRVMDYDGTGIPNADIIADHDRRFKTDSDGFFIFTVEGYEKFMLSASQPGYSMVSKQINASIDKEVEFRLLRVPDSPKYRIHVYVSDEEGKSVKETAGLNAAVELWYMKDSVNHLIRKGIAKRSEDSRIAFDECSFYVPIPGRYEVKAYVPVLFTDKGIMPVAESKHYIPCQYSSGTKFDTRSSYQDSDDYGSFNTLVLKCEDGIATIEKKYLYHSDNKVLTYTEVSENGEDIARIFLVTDTAMHRATYHWAIKLLQDYTNVLVPSVVSGIVSSSITSSEYYESVTGKNLWTKEGIGAGTSFISNIVVTSGYSHAKEGELSSDLDIPFFLTKYFSKKGISWGLAGIGVKSATKASVLSAVAVSAGEVIYDRLESEWLIHDKAQSDDLEVSRIYSHKEPSSEREGYTVEHTKIRIKNLAQPLHSVYLWYPRKYIKEKDEKGKEKDVLVEWIRYLGINKDTWVDEPTKIPILNTDDETIIEVKWQHANNISTDELQLRYAILMYILPAGDNDVYEDWLSFSIPVGEYGINNIIDYFGTNNLVISAYCPVSLSIVDPQGQIINKNNNNIPNAKYIENDLDGDGDLDEQVIITNKLKGDYIINVIPKTGSKHSDTYTLEISSENQKMMVAEDVAIKDIPQNGYVFNTTINQLIISTASEEKSSLSISPEKLSVQKDDKFTVNIEVNKITDLFGASFELQFNGDILEATGAKPGDALGGDVVFLNVPSEGKISVAISKKEGDEPFSGSGTLATIDFKAKADGRTEITFGKSKLTLQEADGSPIPGFSELTLAPCEITVGQALQAMISMETSDVQVKPGDEFALEAVVSDIDKLFGASFEIQYDGSILEYVSSSVGDFMGSDVVFFSIKGDNAINMAISMKAGADPASGTGTLAEIKFKARSAGKSQVSYREDTLALNYSDGTPISVTVSNCSVTVGEEIVKGDVNNDGNVRSNDAILALRIASGLIEPTPEQRQAADMNDDGMVRSNDAILILREAAGLAAPGINALPAANRKVTVTLPESHGVAGERLTIPLKVDNADLLAGGDVCITYDNTVLRALGVESNLMLVSNIRESGRVYLSFAGVHGLREDTLADIQFDILRDSVSSLEFDTVELYQPDALPLASGRLNGRFSSWAIPPERSDLMQNYPNPFNPETWIPYQLRKGGEVTVRIHSITGELIRELKLGYKSAGLYVTQDRAAYWDGRNEAGELAASGVYFYHIQAGDFADTRKMTLAK